MRVCAAPIPVADTMSSSSRPVAVKRRLKRMAVETEDDCECTKGQECSQCKDPLTSRNSQATSKHPGSIDETKNVSIAKKKKKQQKTIPGIGRMSVVLVKVMLVRLMMQLMFL